MYTRPKIRRWGLAFAAILAGLALIAWPLVHPAQGDQPSGNYPHMRRALNELRKSKLELKEGARAFGHHREEALQAVDAAIRQLDNCLKLTD